MCFLLPRALSHTHTHTHTRARARARTQSLSLARTVQNFYTPPPPRFSAFLGCTTLAVKELLPPLLALLQPGFSAAHPPALAAAEQAPLPSVTAVIGTLGSVCKALEFVRALAAEELPAPLPAGSSVAAARPISASTAVALADLVQLTQRLCTSLAEVPEKALLSVRPGGSGADAHAAAVCQCVAAAIDALRSAHPAASHTVLRLNLRLLTPALEGSSSARAKWAVSALKAAVRALQTSAAAPSAGAASRQPGPGEAVAAELLAWLEGSSGGSTGGGGGGGRSALLPLSRVLHPSAHEDVLAACCDLLSELACAAPAAAAPHPSHLSSSEGVGAAVGAPLLPPGLVRR
jgi:hypothetical protein